jgi:VIT1/CCC1 family predicted Fe2+/Mn2+ transporter
MRPAPLRNSPERRVSRVPSPSTDGPTPPAPREIARFRNNLQGEVDGAALYRLFAEAEPHPDIATVYRRLAEAEDRHAALWREKLEVAVGEVPSLQVGWRVQVLGWLARRFGASAVLPVALNLEASNSHAYDQQPDAVAAGLPADERSHARIFRHLTASSRNGLSGEAVARLEGRHRASGGNALRAAVLGANDGLVSNLSLVMGVAGAALQQSTILLTGLAGLLAGAISMALGEWLSVQSSRELYQRQISIEESELQEFPEEEKEELALIYQAKGLPPEQARELASRLVADPATALDTMAREELGIDPEGLGGSAWVAAGTSFVLFATGAIIPVLPYLFVGGTVAVLVSALLSAIGLFVIGAGITLFTGRNPLWSGLRQVAFGLAAAVVTFGLGKIVGIGLGV